METIDALAWDSQLNTARIPRRFRWAGNGIGSYTWSDGCYFPLNGNSWYGGPACHHHLVTTMPGFEWLDGPDGTPVSVSDRADRGVARKSGGFRRFWWPADGGERNYGCYSLGNDSWHADVETRHYTRGMPPMPGLVWIDDLARIDEREEVVYLVAR